MLQGIYEIVSDYTNDEKWFNIAIFSISPILENCSFVIRYLKTVDKSYLLCNN